MSEVKPFRIFNGEVSNVATKVFGGEASGIRDWDDIKYPHLLEINKQLFSEYWIEDEIRLGDDVKDYKQKLTEREQYVFDVLTGMLTELDSFATDFNFVLGYICTDPSVRSILALINSFEVLHNRSYQYLSSTMLNSEQKKRAFNAPKEVRLLVEKADMINEKIQKLIDNAYLLIKEKGELTDELLEIIYDAILAYIMLEGLFFSAGFAYFHSLARSQRMIGSNNMINLIKQDETQHNVFYGDLMRILMLENPQLNTQERHDKSIEFIKECVGKEKEWARFIFDGITTLSIKEYDDYVEYLTNVICRNAGLKEAFPENRELKSKWIMTFGSKRKDSNNEDAIATRGDFFQTNVINYGHEGGEGFDL